MAFESTQKYNFQNIGESHQVHLVVRFFYQCILLTMLKILNKLFSMTNFVLNPFHLLKDIELCKTTKAHFYAQTMQSNAFCLHKIRKGTFEIESCL